MGAVGTHHYGIAASSVATMRVIGQVRSMGIVAMVFAVVLGPVQITPAVYPQLQTALTLSLGMAAVLGLPGIYLSLVRGRMRAT